MHSNVVVEILIEDDVFNVPEEKKVGRTIIVKIPHGFCVKVMVQKLAERHPDLVHPVVTLSYFEDNSKQHNLLKFYRKFLPGNSILIEFFLLQARLFNVKKESELVYAFLL